MNTTYTYLQVGTDNFLASANLTTGWWKTGSNKLQEVVETSKFNYDDQARRQFEDRYDQYYYDSNAAHTNYGNVSGNYSGAAFSQNETAAVKLYDGEGAVRAYQGVYGYLDSNSTTTTTGNLSTVSEDWVRGSDWGGGIGGILYSQALSGNANTAKYYHYDGRGDVVALTSNTGAVTYQAAYDAYGTHGNVSTKGTEESGTDTDPFRTNTREEWLSADGTTFVNERHRPRDLNTDTYFTRDPLGQAPGPNWYTYVNQDEWTKTDPDGRLAIPYPVLPELGPVGWAILGGTAIYGGYELYEHYHQATPPPSSDQSPAPTTAQSPPKPEPSVTPAPPLPISTGGNNGGAPPKATEGFTANAPGTGTPTEGFTPGPALPVNPPPSAASPSGSAHADIMNSVINGNSAQSPNPQIVYVIRDANGNVLKYGVSGQTPNADGTHPRINQQTKGTNNTGEVVGTVPGGPGARQKALDIEQQKVDEHAAQNDGDGPPQNKRPQPTDQGTGGSQ